MFNTKDVKTGLLGDLQRLETKPGDKFVLTHPGCLSAEDVARIQEYFKAWSDDSPVLVLAEGMKLVVVSGEPVTPPASTVIFEIDGRQIASAVIAP